MRVHAVDVIRPDKINFIEPSPRPSPGVPGEGEFSPPRLHIKILRSFYFAFAGLFYLFRTQRNARIHLLMAAAACGLAAWLGISRSDWAILALTIAAVIILEGLNTAMEAAVDLASPQLHPLAKTAKDVTAGMVLVAAIASVAVGLLILGPPLWYKLGL